jgi:hypothetical protein
MRKLNWQCDACGMSAGRKTSVQRHIDNPNIHNGGGRVEPYAGSSNGSENRKHPSRKVFQGMSSRPSDENLVVRIEKEVENEIVREIAKKIFQSVSHEHLWFRQMESLARGYIEKKMSIGLLREFVKFRDGES